MVFLTRNGHLAFAGTPAEARRYFGVSDLVEAYRRLASEDTPRAWAERIAAWRQPAKAWPSRAKPWPGRRVWGRICDRIFAALTDTEGVVVSFRVHSGS